MDLSEQDLGTLILGTPTTVGSVVVKARGVDEDYTSSQTLVMEVAWREGGKRKRSS